MMYLLRPEVYEWDLLRYSWSPRAGREAPVELTAGAGRIREGDGHLPGMLPWACRTCQDGLLDPAWRGRGVTQGLSPLSWVMTGLGPYLGLLITSPAPLSTCCNSMLGPKSGYALGQS